MVGGRVIGKGERGRVHP